MNVVVTRNSVEYSGKNFLKVTTLKEANSLVGVIDFLVYNKSTESSQEKVEFLNSLKSKAKQIVYICEAADVDLSVKMVVLGSNGKYLDDEFFLESEDELYNLVNSLGEISEIAELGGADVLSGFLDRYLRDGSNDKTFNKNYLGVVKQAVVQLLEDYSSSQLEVLKLAETATDLFSNTSTIVSSMKLEKEKLQALVTDMTNKLEETPMKRRVSANASVLFYPQVQYPKEKSIIRIKELGNVRYLISWVLGFRNYLEGIKNVRPKVIIVAPVGTNIEDKYSDYSWVKQSTVRVMSNYYSNVVFTNCPSRDVMFKLLDDSDYDTFIVVDRTVTAKDHILNSKGSSVKYAVSGLSSIDRFKVKRDVCFSSCTEINKSMFSIPIYVDYPLETSSRERLYLSNCGESFEKMYSDVHRR